MTDNELHKHHEGISQYVRKRRWFSISANEVVEYSIRSLLIGDKLSTPNIMLRVGGFCFFVLLLILFFPFYFIFTMLYFSFHYVKKSKNNVRLNIRDVFFIRNNLSKKKHALLVKSHLIKGSTVVVDDFEFNYESENNVKLSSYLRFAPMVYLVKLLKEIFNITKDFVFNTPKFDLLKLFRAYARAPHLILLELSLSNMLEVNNVNHIRTFEMISRFSSLLNLLRHRYNVNAATCYPHGLEYDIYYPRGYFGDTVYSTSIHAAKKLNNRYGFSNFKFDKKIIDTLFVYDDVKLKEPKEYVYYTDARNIKDDYSNMVSLQDRVKYVKLHPIDNISNYPNIDLIVIEEFDEAISYGAIIMRASTVLFEGFNSNCSVYCLSTNDKEKYLTDYLYPTLSDLGVEKISSLDDLKLKKEI